MGLDDLGAADSEIVTLSDQFIYLSHEHPSLVKPHTSVV